MAQGVKIGSGYVDINADMKNFDKAMNALPSKSAAKIDATMKALQAQMARNKLEIKAAWNSGAGLAAVRALTAEQDRLRAKIEAATGAAIKQATALQAAARASLSGTVLPTGPRDPRDRFDSASLDRLTRGGRIDFAALGATGKKAGADIAAGGSNGAMGLMMLSQAIDDAQYGFRSLVNNIPMLTSTMASSMGMSTEAANKLGGALGIAAVAVNTWIKNWEHAKEIFGGDWSTKLAKQFDVVKEAILNAAGVLANLDKGIVAFGSRDMANMVRGKQEKAKQAADIEAAKQTAASAVEGVKGEEEQKRASAFGEALEKYGGGTKLREELARPMIAQAEANARARAKNESLNGAQTDDAVAKARKAATDAANLLVANALEGREGAAEQITSRNKGFAGIYRTPEQIEQAGYEQQGREHGREYARKQRELGRDLTAQGADIEFETRQQMDQEKDREADRFAAVLQPRMSKSLLGAEGTSPDDLKGDVEKAMQKAGVKQKDIDGILNRVVARIKNQTTEKIEERAASRGISTGDAKTQLLKEEREREMAERLKGVEKKGDFVSGADAIFKAAQVSATEQDVLKAQGMDVNKEQLQVAKESKKDLAAIRKSLRDHPRQVARFGPNRG